MLLFPAVWAVQATCIFAKLEAPHHLCHAVDGQLAAIAEGDSICFGVGQRRCPASVAADMAAGRAGQTMCDAGWGRVGRDRPVNRLFDAYLAKTLFSF